MVRGQNQESPKEKCSGLAGETRLFSIFFSCHSLGRVPPTSSEDFCPEGLGEGRSSLRNVTRTLPLRAVALYRTSTGVGKEEKIIESGYIECLEIGTSPRITSRMSRHVGRATSFYPDRAFRPFQHSGVHQKRYQREDPLPGAVIPHI